MLLNANLKRRLDTGIIEWDKLKLRQ